MHVRGGNEGEYEKLPSSSSSSSEGELDATIEAGDKIKY
jgi:hypothetical protein